MTIVFGRHGPNRGLPARPHGGAEAVILGCTEIGILVRQDDTRVKLVDTTEIHAQKVVAEAIGLDL